MIIVKKLMRCMKSSCSVTVDTRHARLTKLTFFRRYAAEAILPKEMDYE